MLIQRNELNFSGQKIYVGIDVHLKSWSVTILTEHLHHKTFTQSSSHSALVHYLTRNFFQSYKQFNRCQPHLTEIFGDYETFETFICDSKLDHVYLINRVRNFWQLYKSNEYEYIEVENRGNVQTIIDGNLEDLMSDVQQVINIEQEFEVLKKTDTKEKHTDNIDKCKVLIDRIDSIELNIKRNRILKTIYVTG